MLGHIISIYCRESQVSACPRDEDGKHVTFSERVRIFTHVASLLLTM